MGNIDKCFRIICYDLANLPIAARQRLDKRSLLISENNAQSIQFHGQEAVLSAEPVGQIRYFFCFVKR